MIKNTRLLQLSLAVLACILAAALYYAPARKNILKSSKSAQSDSKSSIENLIIEAKEGLNSNQLNRIISLETTIESADKTNKIALYDSIATSWAVIKNPYLAGYYYGLKAKLDFNVESYLQGGRHYFTAFNSLKDSSFKTNSLIEATALYEKAHELEPDNDDITLELALSYIENPANPMQGISLLRKLVEDNPKNENAIFNLGLLSMRSGQYDKAIARFEQILVFEPERHELFLYIADSYVQIGENDKAIVYFSRFKSKTKDQNLRDEIDRYIIKLTEE